MPPKPPRPPLASADAAASAPPRWRAWWHAARVHTLPLSLVPVLAACALLRARGVPLHVPLALACALVALCLQLGVNWLNDVGDFERGGDGAQRLGPARACAQGWLAAHEVRRAGLGALAVALLAGLPLVPLGGWPLAAAGLLALLCAWAYTAGPRPIAHGAWGEALVWLFFGQVPVLGVCWLQMGALPPFAPWLGHALGALAAAVMLVNNTRDAAADALCGRRTLAMRLGARGCRVLYALLLAQPFLCWPMLVRHGAAVGMGAADVRAWAWLPWLALPAAVGLALRFARLPASAAMNALLAHTARLQAVWAALLVAAALLAGA